MGRRLLLFILYLVGLSFFLAANALRGECQTVDNFFIYTDKNSPLNHFIPSGWMGDYGDLRMNDQATDEFSSRAPPL